MKLYLAGPMRGYPRFNFDVFYEAEADLIYMGFDVVNPARIEEESGFDPNDSEQEISNEMIEGFIRRDLESILGCDGIVLLPDWSRSTGANAEYWLARWLSKKIFILVHKVHAKTGTPLGSVDDIIVGCGAERPGKGIHL